MTMWTKRNNLLLSANRYYLNPKVKVTQAVLPGVIVGQLNWSNVIIVALLSLHLLHKSCAHQVAHVSAI